PHSSSRIERDDTGVDRAEVNTPTTDGVACGARVEPRRNAAVGEVAPVTIAFDMRVIRPPRGAAFRVEREHASERRGEIQRAVDHEGRRLELDRSSRGDVRLARSIRP